MTLKPARRYQPRSPYGYCKHGDWQDSGSGCPDSRAVVAEAELHWLATGGENGGHQVVVEWHQRLLIGQPERMAGAR